MECTSNVLAFQRAARRVGLDCLTQGTDGNRREVYFGCHVVGSGEHWPAPQLVVAPERLQYCRQTQGGERDYGLLR